MDLGLPPVEDDVFDGWDSVTLIKSLQRGYRRGQKYSRNYMRKKATTPEVAIGWIFLVGIAGLVIWAVLIIK